MMEVKTILVIEDNNDIGEFLTLAIMNETSYQALHASDSSQAWNLMQNIKPDAIILDYHLPYLTGIEFYDRVHATEAFKDIPVLIVSAFPEQCQHEVEERHLSFLEKPFELDTLLKTITNFLEEEPM